MSADPYDFRCRHCGLGIDLPPATTVADEWCSPACREAGPANPFTRAADWIRRWWPRPPATVDAGLGLILGDQLAWTVHLNTVTRAEEPLVQDWLTLHGVALRKVTDTGLIEVYAGRRGAYLLVDVDGGPQRIPLVLAPPLLTGAEQYQRLRRTDIAEGNPAT